MLDEPIAGEFTARDGRRIAYSDWKNDGPPVLCLAGLTRDARDFAPLLPTLLPGYRVIAMDYRGRGRSAWATDPVAEYQIAIEAGDALELLDKLEVPAATIIGTSRGGLIGMGLAVQAPGRVKALVLNDVGPALSLSGLNFIMTYLGKAPSYPDFDAAAAGFHDIYADIAPDLSLADWRAFAERTFHKGEEGEPVLSYDPTLRDAVSASLPDDPEDLPELWPLFEAISCPVLALRGANSDLLTAEAFAEMARRKPDLHAATVPNRGHCPMLDEPAVTAALVPFLEAHA